MSKEATEIRISNVQPTLKRELDNIAANVGVGLTPFLKMKLREVANSYPPEMKKPIKD